MSRRTERIGEQIRAELARLLREEATDPRIGLVSLPGNSAKLPGYDQDDDSIRWDVGLEATLGQATSLNVTGGLTDADNGDAFWYGAELVYSF